MLTLEELILTTGPLMSSDLAKEYAKKTDITEAASRKRISRATSPINKLNLGFINNQSFIYHDRQFDTELYWDKLEQSLRNNSKAYYSIIRAISYHSGFSRISELPAHTSLPIRRFKSRIQYKHVEKKLIEIDALEYQDVDTYRLNDHLYPNKNFYRFRAVELTKKQVVDDFTQWAARQNLVSFNASRSFDSEAQFGGFQWCYTAPSYIQGLNPTLNRQKPGFLVADILIGRKVDKDDIEYFIDKVEILRSRSTLRKFIPLLLCDFVEPEGHQLLKNNGVWVGIIKELFGDSYSEILKGLLDTLTNATSVIEDNPERLYDLTMSLTKLKGQFSNIRGDLFELAVGYYFSLKNYPIKIGKLITDKKTGKSKEIDVYINDNTELRLVECKSYSKPLEKSDVIEWLDKIPIIKSWANDQDDLSSKKQTFELWSISGFDEEATELLSYRKGQVKPTKYIIEYHDREAITLKAKDTKNKKLQEILDAYFTWLE